MVKCGYQVTQVVFFAFMRVKGYNVDADDMMGGVKDVVAAIYVGEQREEDSDIRQGRRARQVEFCRPFCGALRHQRRPKQVDE